MSSRRGFAAAMIALVATACAPTRPLPPAPSLPAPAPATTSIAGAWLLKTESPVGSQDADAVFTQAGEALAGRIIEQRREMELSGTVKGDAVAFGLHVLVHGRDLKIDYTGIVHGDTMSGTVQFGPFGQGRWSGTRKVE